MTLVAMFDSKITNLIKKNYFHVQKCWTPVSSNWTIRYCVHLPQYSYINNARVLHLWLTYGQARRKHASWRGAPFVLEVSSEESELLFIIQFQILEELIIDSVTSIIHRSQKQHLKQVSFCFVFTHNLVKNK